MILRRPPQVAHALRSEENTRASRAAHPRRWVQDGALEAPSPPARQVRLELFNQGTAQHVYLLLGEAPIQGVCLYSTVSFFEVLKQFEHTLGRAMVLPILLKGLTRSYARWRWEPC